MGAPRSHLLQQIAETRRHNGAWATVKWFLARAAKKLLQLEVSEMVWLEKCRLPKSIQADPEFTFRFLTVDEVADLAAQSDYELAPEFVSRAAGDYELCFAALDGEGQVANYGWYALHSIEGAHHMGVSLSFPDNVAYMYNAFTHPRYRGRRLHGTAMALALQSLADRGITRLISTIEWTNYPSLRSFERLGFAKLGRLWTLGRGNCRWNRSPKAAQSLGIRFGNAAAVLPRSAVENVVAAV